MGINRKLRNCVYSFSFLFVFVRREVRVMILSWRKSGMHLHGNQFSLIRVPFGV